VRRFLKKVGVEKSVRGEIRAEEKSVRVELGVF